MKKRIGIIGSRTLFPNIADYLNPDDCQEIVSGGARGVDSCAASFARENNISLTEFLPDYTRYGRGAPHRRNDQIIQAVDIMYVFWDGKSRGTASVIKKCKRAGVPVCLERL